MTPASVVTAARRGYNAVDDTAFFDEAELYDYLFKAETELAHFSDCIPTTETSTTVTGTSQYTLPSGMYRIKRLTYDSSGRVTAIEFANGSPNFDQAFVNPENLSYS